MAPPNPYWFDLDFFRRVFPKVPVSESGTCLGDVCGPSSLVEVEEFRRVIGGHLDRAEKCPVDVFTWSIGEPPDRHVTKIGGLPYRPAQAPWPQSASGTPRVFLAQFLFTDTVVDVGSLPGCTLLIFVDDQPSDDWCDGSFSLEWQPTGIVDLIEASEMPSSSIRVPALFGVRHRTFDLRDTLAEDLVSIAAQHSIDSPDGVARSLSCWDATKIGGVPIEALKSACDGVLLCTLISMFPMSGVLYPYVNRERPWENARGDDIPIFSQGSLGEGYFRLAITINRAKGFSVHFHREYC